MKTSTRLNDADEACLQEVIGSLIISSSLREALEVEGVEAFRTHQDDLATSITPGAWRAIRRIMPRTYVDLAVAVEDERRRRVMPDAPHKHRFDAA